MVEFESFFALFRVGKSEIENIYVLYVSFKKAITEPAESQQKLAHDLVASGGNSGGREIMLTKNNFYIKKVVTSILCWLVCILIN